MLLDTLAWTCLTYAVPADWHPYSEVDPTDEGERVAELVFAWIDDECWAPCDGSLGYAGDGCEQAVCTTGLGVEVEAVRGYSEYDSDSMGTHLESVRWARLGAGEALALGFTAAEVEEVHHSWSTSSTYSGSWSWVEASWTGTLDADLPADSVVRASRSDASEGGFDVESAAWTDPVCAWTYAKARAGDETDDTVTVSGVSLWVRDADSCTSHRLASYNGGADELVDHAEWTRLPDADGDHTPDVDDCAPADAAISPCAAEAACDGVDQDCSGADTDDVDGDGYAAAACGGDDCDDARGSVHPDAREREGNGVDEDCDGVDGPTDADGDGHDAVLYGGDDCDDTRTSVHPGAGEITDDDVDQDCDGFDDRDQDDDDDGHVGLAAGGDDCDDARADVHPDADDATGDGVDQDCDGADDLPVDTAEPEPEDERPGSESPEPGCAGVPSRPTATALLAAAGALWARRRLRPAGP